MNSEPDEPALFDLPLAPPGMHEGGAPEPGEPGSRRSRARAARPESLPLFDEGDLSPAPARAPKTEAAPPPPKPRSYEPLPRAESSSGPVEAARPGRERLELVSGARTTPEPAADEIAATPTATLAPRLRAGLGDLTVLSATAAIAALGADRLGGSLSPRELPALLVFLLAFSFLYCVVSLAFWGQTPGMAWSGLVARADETEPLSFGQTARRWLGHWLTWAFLGLPALLAARGAAGRSLADRISGTATYELQSR
jgi:uncharacterized RDD family membrane protein YckC